MIISFCLIIINNKININLILTKLKMNNSKHNVYIACMEFRINVTIIKVLKKNKIIL